MSEDLVAVAHGLPEPVSEPVQEAPAVPSRLRQLAPLEKVRDDGEALADRVKDNLDDLWSTGGRVATQAGRRPVGIHIRRNMLLRPRLHASGDPDGPPEDATPGKGEGVVQRLIKSRGLQLRLELLLLFDAQCRHDAGGKVRNVRTISPGSDDKYVCWRQLVLTGSHPEKGSGRTARDLRVRQITEALKVLQREHLIFLPTDPAGRRRYDKFKVLTETGTSDDPPYTVPEGHTPATFAISRHFFTNMWVFALTDTEIATYLMLSLLRARFASRHQNGGVFAVNGDRLAAFGLTRTTYRSHAMLHRFGLIDRLPDPDRDFETGQVHDFGKKYAQGKGSVRAHRFQINDGALERPALETIRRTLTTPTPEEKFRMASGFSTITGLDSAGLQAPLSFQPTVSM